MKTALILFKNNESRFDVDELKDILDVFNQGGINFNTVEMLSCDDDTGFRNRFSYLRDTADNLIVVLSKLSFDAKSIMAEVMDTELILNDNAEKFAQAVCKDFNSEYVEDCAILPIDATVIPNLKGTMQGFMLEEGEFSLVVLPEKKEELKHMCEGYVVPYFDTKYKIKKERFTFKYFGEREILDKTLKETEEFCEFNKTVKTLNGDSLVNLIFTEQNDNNVSSAKRYIIEKLGGRIYAEFDTSLGERLFDLLKLRNVKLSTAESFTGGRVISAVISNSGASNYVNEGVVSYSNLSKRERLGVKEEDLKSVGAVSSQVAYEMAAGLIIKGNCDIAISTTGIAGPKSDDTLKPVGLNYIGIGMKDGVHVYKYELKGDREEITETAKNTALFLAIKKLKNI